MPYLNLPRMHAVINPSLPNNSSADATANRHVKNRILIASCAQNRLRQRRNIGIIIDNHRHPKL